MKKIISVLVMTVLTIGVGFSQGSLGKNDPAAKTILDKVSAKFKTFKAVQSGFNLEVKDASGKVQGSKKGTVFMKGGKYRVTLTGQEIFCDGQTIWTYDKAANEVTITKFDASGSAITPQKMFTNFYDKDFLYKLNGEKVVAGKTIQEIELTPVDKSKAFSKVYVYVDKASQSITSTSVIEKNNNRYTYAINSMNTNATIPDTQFVFDKKKKIPGR